MPSGLSRLILAPVVLPSGFYADSYARYKLAHIISIGLIPVCDGSSRYCNSTYEQMVTTQRYKALATTDNVFK